MNHAIISWLRNQGHDVTVMLTGLRLTVPIERYKQAHVIGPHLRSAGAYVVATPLAIGRMFSRRLFRWLPIGVRKLLRRTTDQADAVLGNFLSPSDLRWCAQAIVKIKPESVLVDTIFRAPLLAQAELEEINTILLTHDVFHRRAETLAALGYRVRPDGLTKTFEVSLLTKAAHIVAIQPEEAELLREMCSQANVFTAPMPALPCPPGPDVKKLLGRLVFVGSDSLPNLDGLKWFFAKIWPELRGHGVTLDLIGDCGPALHQLPPGVNALGRVPNLAPVLHRAALAISPLRTGSGLKIKLLDYARHGLFTVATAPSVQGFAGDIEFPFIVADNADMFAEAILKHAAAPEPSDAALAYISRHYNTEKAFAGLKDALSPINCQQNISG